MGNSDRSFDRYFMEVHVSEYYWCHGTYCHTHQTLDRVRGSKGSKVLRTKKIKINPNGYPTGFYKYFCSQHCYNEFANEHAERIIALAPRHAPLETQIEDPIQEKSRYGYSYTTIVKKGIDNNSD